MLTCLFSSGDLLRTRFAISPLREMIGSVEALSNPASASIHVPWIRAVRPRLAGLDLAPLAALPRPPGSYQPDFIAPPPQTPLPDVHEEIERIRQTPPEQLRWELHEAYPDGRLPPALGPLLSRPRTAAGAIADLVAPTGNVRSSPTGKRSATRLRTTSPIAPACSQPADKQRSSTTFTPTSAGATATSRSNAQHTNKQSISPAAA